MSETMGERDFYAETYDVSVPDWPGEIAFYWELAAIAASRGGKVLELACGTGRVALRLVDVGVSVVGLDLSADMLDVARRRSAGDPRLRWAEGDMRSFDLGETFDLIIIPGHAFQNLNTAGDQVACLTCARRHLAPQGTLVVHLDYQDMGWLGDLRGDKGGVFEPKEEFTHPETGRPIRALRAWRYEPATQSAIKEMIWEDIGTGEGAGRRWETGPIRLHCVFPLEMEHLLARVGFEDVVVYGDFDRQPLGDDSPQMVWVASVGPTES